jgi:hypothetical protein
MFTIQGIHQTSDLIPIPDVTPLELWQGNAAEVDLVENGLDLHRGTPE